MHSCDFIMFSRNSIRPSKEFKTFIPFPSPTPVCIQLVPLFKFDVICDRLSFWGIKDIEQLFLCDNFLLKQPLEQHFCCLHVTYLFLAAHSRDSLKCVEVIAFVSELSMHSFRTLVRQAFTNLDRDYLVLTQSSKEILALILGIFV